MLWERTTPVSGEVRVAGLRDRVEVIRDTCGVPHIYAQNDDDLFFAQGYVMAQFAFTADAKAVNPHLRIVGFTATPYRLKSGLMAPGRTWSTNSGDRAMPVTVRVFQRPLMTAP